MSFSEEEAEEVFEELGMEYELIEPNEESTDYNNALYLSALLEKACITAKKLGLTALDLEESIRRAIK